MKVAVAGLGYVGLSNAILLSRFHEVIAFDIDVARVKMLNQGVSPITDDDISDHLKDKSKINFHATAKYEEAFSQARFIIVATPTDYDSKTGKFDTQSIEAVVEQAYSVNPSAIIVIKSTVPVGYTRDLIASSGAKIIFSPEFLREGRALTDNLYPSRIVVGGESSWSKDFADVMSDSALGEDIPIILCEPDDAEAIKLFSNTYLAMRVSFFNELDCFGEINGLSLKKVIAGVCADNRIGDHYNNPSFGYGGYCLPKDTKQLLENFSGIPNSLIKATVDSNEKRKNFIVNSITNKTLNTIGIYRLIMKDGSDNYRESAVLDILEKIKGKENKIILYEPLISENEFNGLKVVNNINEFIKCSDLIIANRISHDLDRVMDKVYSRDLFHEN